MPGQRFVPDWQLPPGVSRGLRDYLRDPSVARRYDADLASSLLFRTDVAFVEKHCPAPGRLLDLGCGTGRLLLPFARRGCFTLGVDLSSEMLKVAGENANRAGVTIHRARLNVTDLSCLADAGFDYAACLFSTLGMVQGREMRRRVCAETHRVLRSGGTFVLHVHNRWHDLWNRPGRRRLIKNWLGSLVGRCTAGDCVMPPHQGIGSLTLHLFTRREAVRLLKSVGFRIVAAQPLSVTGNGLLKCGWWLGRLRAYGYLIAARKE